MYESAAFIYSISGATGEIFVMLLVAFVLGALLGRAAASPEPIKRYASTRRQLPAIRRDNLTLIEGLHRSAEAHLNAHGIFTWKMLSQTPADRLERMFAGIVMQPIRYVQTWPTQAALASRNEWTRLKEMQESLT